MFVAEFVDYENLPFGGGAFVFKRWLKKTTLEVFAINTNPAQAGNLERGTSTVLAVTVEAEWAVLALHRLN